MTNDERIRAVIDCGFTERQARFLVLVMCHAGVCVPRQYAEFAGIANGGRRCNLFFDRLVARGFAHEIRCAHNRARIYQLRHKQLYCLIAEDPSRHRRPMSPRMVVERLMLLDALLAIPDVVWLTTAEQTGYLERLTGAAAADAAAPQAATRDDASALSSRLTVPPPIGIAPDGRTVLVFVASPPPTASGPSYRRAGSSYEPPRVGRCGWSSATASSRLRDLSDRHPSGGRAGRRRASSRAAAACCAQPRRH